MFGKFNELSIRAYMKAAKLKQKAIKAGKRLMEDERGLSGVVVAVLLILVAVLAVVLLWGNLKTWIETMWGTITGKASGIT